MKQINNALQKYLTYAFPIVIATLLWGSFQTDSEIRAGGSFVAKFFWEIMSWSLILWFASLLIFMFLLVFRKDTQESTIKYLAGIKERDAREQAIMGLAARRAFVSTTALLICLIFLSCLTVTITHTPDHSIDSRNSSLSLGFHFTGTDEQNSSITNKEVVYQHHDIPLSKSSLLLIVLFWKVASFKFRARKEMIGD